MIMINCNKQKKPKQNNKPVDGITDSEDEANPTTNTNRRLSPQRQRSLKQQRQAAAVETAIDSAGDGKKKKKKKTKGKSMEELNEENDMYVGSDSDYEKYNYVLPDTTPVVQHKPTDFWWSQLSMLQSSTNTNPSVHLSEQDMEINRLLSELSKEYI